MKAHGTNAAGHDGRQGIAIDSQGIASGGYESPSDGHKIASADQKGRSAEGHTAVRRDIREDSRSRLINAMADLLWQHGYAATSPRDVMALAGVGQGSMYHHFSGKHELATVAFEQVAETLTQQSSLLEMQGSPLERMKQYLLIPRPGIKGCRVGRMTQDPQVIEDGPLLDIVAHSFAVAQQRWETTIAEAVKVGELPSSVNPADLARTLAAVIQGGYVLAKAEQQQAPMDAAIRGAIQLLDAASSGAGHPRDPHTDAAAD